MKPYYQTHSAGWLFLLLVIAFFGVEIIQFFRQRGWRRNATRVATPVFWVGVAAWAVVATVMLHGGSRLAPGASMGNGVVVFIVGMVLLTAGAALRWGSFWALGQYFTFTVDVSTDQDVVTRGPYRVLRHPGYTGGLLAVIGIGVIYANWVGLAGSFLAENPALHPWRRGHSGTAAGSLALRGKASLCPSRRDSSRAPLAGYLQIAGFGTVAGLENRGDP
jgi:protein-S-isoprenylcysteine O-methyltransferase Ste14